MTSEYPLDKSCVTIEPLDPQPCDGCGDSVEEETGALAGAWATRQVMLDLRNNGTTICIGIYCDDCAEEVASRLRDSLPHGPDDDVAFMDSLAQADAEVNREEYLAQTLKETFVSYVGNDMTQWPERQQEFRRIAAQAIRGELWKMDDWKCKRCDTMNLEAAESCRKCGKERGERVIMRTNTVPISLLERVLDDRVEDLHKWAEGKDFHAPPSFLPPPEGEPGEVCGPGRGKPTVEPENMSLLQREEEQSKADAQHGDAYPPATEFQE